MVEAGGGRGGGGGGSRWRRSATRRLDRGEPAKLEGLEGEVKDGSSKQKGA